MRNVITLEGLESKSCNLFDLSFFICMHPSLWRMDFDGNLREVSEHVQWFILGVLDNSYFVESISSGNH